MCLLDFRLYSVNNVLLCVSVWYLVELHALHTHTAECCFTPRPQAEPSCWDMQPSPPYCVPAPGPRGRSCWCSQSSSDSDPWASGARWQKTRPYACPRGPSERQDTRKQMPLTYWEESLFMHQCDKVWIYANTYYANNKYIYIWISIYQGIKKCWYPKRSDWAISISIQHFVTKEFPFQRPFQSRDKKHLDSGQLMYYIYFLYINTILFFIEII